MAKTINTRIQHKYDTIEKWKSVENSFIPLSGEFVIYAPGTDNGVTYGVRQKIGNGVSVLGQLPFVAVEGTVPVTQGGTGATTAAEARTNLGAAPAYTAGTEDLTAGTSPLESGKLYFVYE